MKIGVFLFHAFGNPGSIFRKPRNLVNFQVPHVDRRQNDLEFMRVCEVIRCFTLLFFHVTPVIQV